VNAQLIIDNLVARLARSFGAPKQVAKARIITFGTAFTCSINYSKPLRGGKYFFGLPPAILGSRVSLPDTKWGAFVLLVCGSADRVLVLPRKLIVEMMEGVSSRRLDVFFEDGSYILQTTQHPKCNVTSYLNAFPAEDPAPKEPKDNTEADEPSRTHLRIQFGLIMLGRAEGCTVWVPTNDRNLSCRGRPLSAHTAGRLPNFGFDENTRRIVENIDVLWLSRNVISKAFEIESTTSIYSGLLRLNDLVLAQPNTHVDLYLAAPTSRRGRVHSQLLRPTFQPLLPKCAFISFEEIEKQTKHLESFSIENGARVSGLLRGEKFAVPEHFIYPTDG
jgi:hypothetical protein